MPIDFADGIRVTAFKKELDEDTGDYFFTNLGSATSATNGSFSIANLPDGDYAFKYEDLGGSVPVIRDAGYFKTTYSGNVDTLDDATTTSVSGGSTATIPDITLIQSGIAYGTVKGNYF